MAVSKKCLWEGFRTSPFFADSANASPQQGAKESNRAQRAQQSVEIANNQVWNNQFWELPISSFFKFCVSRSFGSILRPSVGCKPKGSCGNRAFYEGFWEGGLLWVLQFKKGPEMGSQKGFWEGGFQKVPRTPRWRVGFLTREAQRLLKAFISTRSPRVFQQSLGWSTAFQGPTPPLKCYTISGGAPSTAT